jgi:hypothetical protein
MKKRNQAKNSLTFEAEHSSAQMANQSHQPKYVIPSLDRLELIPAPLRRYRSKYSISEKLSYGTANPTRLNTPCVYSAGKIVDQVKERDRNILTRMIDSLGDRKSPPVSGMFLKIFSGIGLELK